MIQQRLLVYPNLRGTSRDYSEFNINVALPPLLYVNAPTSGLTTHCQLRKMNSRPGPEPPDSWVSVKPSSILRYRTGRRVRYLAPPLCPQSPRVVPSVITFPTLTYLSYRFKGAAWIDLKPNQRGTRTVHLAAVIKQLRRGNRMSSGGEVDAVMSAWGSNALFTAVDVYP